MKDVMYAIWDLLKLSLKTGKYSSLTNYLRDMRAAAINAGGLWEFGIKECGSAPKYKQHMQDAGNKFSQRLEKENKSNISKKIESEKDGRSVGYSLVMGISVAKAKATNQGNYRSEYYDNYDNSLNWEDRAEKYNNN